LELGQVVAQPLDHVARVALAALAVGPAAGAVRSAAAAAIARGAVGRFARAVAGFARCAAEAGAGTAFASTGTIAELFAELFTLGLVQHVHELFADGLHDLAHFLEPLARLLALEVLHRG